MVMFSVHYPLQAAAAELRRIGESIQPE